jgi:hypothetical protein
VRSVSRGRREQGARLELSAAALGVHDLVSVAAAVGFAMHGGYSLNSTARVLQV